MAEFHLLIDTNGNKLLIDADNFLIIGESAAVIEGSGHPARLSDERMQSCVVDDRTHARISDDKTHASVPDISHGG